MRGPSAATKLEPSWTMLPIHTWTKWWFHKPANALGSFVFWDWFHPKKTQQPPLFSLSFPPFCWIVLFWGSGPNVTGRFAATRGRDVPEKKINRAHATPLLWSQVFLRLVAPEILEAPGAHIAADITSSFVPIGIKRNHARWLRGEHAIVVRVTRLLLCRSCILSLQMLWEGFGFRWRGLDAVPTDSLSNNKPSAINLWMAQKKSGASIFIFTWQQVSCQVSGGKCEGWQKGKFLPRKNCKSFVCLNISPSRIHYVN